MLTGNTADAVPEARATGEFALAAWSEFSGMPLDHERIEMLRGGKKAVTYRIFGAGPAGTSVIAQRCRMKKAMNERVVYQQILPHVPVTSPRMYGVKPEGPDHAWLFLEDVGNERYLENDPMHRRLAGRWVGALHSAASRVPDARSFPDGGPQRYLDHLRTARATISAHVDNPALGAEDSDLLRRVVRDLDALDADWARVERACAGVPPTLVHGDFRPKNAYLREMRDGLGLFPIDWETAGWGVPAADLTRIDLPSYLSALDASWWPGVRLADLERVAAAGQIFQSLVAMFWVAPQLKYEDYLWLMRPISCFRVFQQRVSRDVQRLEELTRPGPSRC
jgi:thiamine kinase-like enzyme